MTGPLTWIVGSTPPGMDPRTLKRITDGKSPTDLTPVTADFRGPLAAIDNDTMSATFTPIVNIIRNDGAAADCYAVGAPTISPDYTRVGVWLAGGTVGCEYLVSTTIMSADGQQLTRSFIIPVTIR